MKASTLISTQSRRRLAPRHALTCLSFQSPGPPAHPPRHQASTSACSPRKHPSAARRSFHRSAAASSDNLLGYSPMAKSAPSKPAAQTPSQGAVWGVDSNTAGGGVWAQTSAKKDKLNELLTELNGEGVDTGRLGEQSIAWISDLPVTVVMCSTCAPEPHVLWSLPASAASVSH